jgi:hypothetical protein
MLQLRACAQGKRRQHATGAVMTQKTLWEFFEDRQEQKQHAEEADREWSRKRSFKKMRAGGHWLILLRVARTIPQPFTLNDISVAAWRVCPEFFSMRGYPYPDNHKVHAILYGKRGLIAKGIIHRVRQGLFQVPHGVDPDQLLQALSQADAEGGEHRPPEADPPA